MVERLRSGKINVWTGVSTTQDFGTLLESKEHFHSEKVLLEMAAHLNVVPTRTRA